MSGLAGAYVLRDSPLHRAPAGWKLVALAVSSSALFLVRSSLAVVTAAVLVTGAYVLARVGPAAPWAQLRPLRFLVPVLFLVQWIVMDAASAAALTSRVVLVVAMAGLVTLTTRTSELMTAIERGLGPLRRIGVDPDRIALTMSLALRAVPVVAGLLTRIREAQRARGCERDLRALAVPLVVGALRQADAMGDALKARGLDD